MKGLLIEVDYRTGERAGGEIDTNDIRGGKLIAPAGVLHQRLDDEDYGDFEVRIVKDERDITKYSGKITTEDRKEYTCIADVPNTSKITDVKGAIPLFNNDEINKAVELGLEPKHYSPYSVGEIEKWLVDNWRMTKEIEDSRKFLRKFYKLAYKAGCPYIREEKPQKV